MKTQVLAWQLTGCLSLCRKLHEGSQGLGARAERLHPLPPPLQEFILSCLARDPARRPSAHNLLFHRVLFEVHSLKLLAAHCFIQHQCEGQVGLGAGQGLGSGCRRKAWQDPMLQGLPPVCSRGP